MKKITRRQFMQCAGVMAAAGALSACGGGSTAAKGGADGKKKLVIFLNAADTTEQWKFIHEVAAFDKYKDVEFVIENYGPQLEEKLPTYVSGGQQIDLVTVENPIMQAQFASAGMTIDLSKYAEAAGVDYKAEFGESYCPFVEYNGGLTMMPASVMTWVTYYIKDIFDAAGVAYPDLEIPMTFDDYQDLALQLTSGTGNEKIYGAFFIPNWVGYIFGNAISELGGGKEFYTADGLCNIQDPAYARSIQRNFDMMHVDESMPTHASLVSMQANATNFMSGRYAMGIGGQWFIDWYKGKETYPREWHVGIAPLPVHEGTTPKTWGALEGLAVPVTTADAQFAFDFAMDYNRHCAANCTVRPGVNTTITSDKLYAGDELLPEGDITNAEMIQCFANPKSEFLAEKIQGPASPVYETIALEEISRFFIEEQDLQSTLDNIETRVNEAIAEESAKSE